MANIKKNKKGFVAMFVVLLLLGIMISLAVSFVFLVIGERRIAQSILTSGQVYYAGEAGLEDALYRLKNELNWTNNYDLACGGALVLINISESVGSSRTITATASIANLTRRVRTAYRIDSTEASFYYGAQIGEGGLTMGNNARVKGNVFSNGDIFSAGNKGYIDNTAVIAGSHSLSGIIVGQEAYTYDCINSSVSGNLSYVSGGMLDKCAVDGSITVLSEPIAPQALPISPSQIEAWKEDAAAGGISLEDYVLDGETEFLGPIQIGTSAQPNNLTIANNARLVINGTIYVTGDIIFNNNAIVELASGYGSTSGMIIADGKISVRNNCELKGSGLAGSYLLLVSEDDSLDDKDPAIFVANNAEGAIFFSSSGISVLGNNMVAREITGYKVHIQGNAEIEYESGLESVLFSSGPGGSWDVVAWREIE